MKTEGQDTSQYRFDRSAEQKSRWTGLPQERKTELVTATGLVAHKGLPPAA